MTTSMIALLRTQYHGPAPFDIEMPYPQALFRASKFIPLALLRTTLIAFTSPNSGRQVRTSTSSGVVVNILHYDQSVCSDTPARNQKLQINVPPM